MKFVYILEKDVRFIDEILENLEKIDPQLKVRIFAELELFANWIQLLAKEGAKAISKGGVSPENFPGLKNQGQAVEAEATSASDQLVLLISDNDILGSRHIDLLKKSQALFVQKEICTKEDPTSIVITGFNNPEFDISAIEGRLINNVIYKPFEKLILLQHLIFAIGGRHPATNNTLHNRKTSAIVEMLKDVDVEAYSDVGFITLSSRPLPIGAVSKYYSDLFKYGKTRNVFAICAQCESHPTLPKLFRSAFIFYGVEPEQLINFRKNIPTKAETEFKFKWRQGSSTANVKIVVIDPEEFGSSPLSGSLQRSFTNVNVIAYKSMGEFLNDLDPTIQATSSGKAVSAFPGGISLAFHFDASSRKFIKTVPALTVSQSILGFSNLEFQKIDFYQWMLDQEKNKVLRMIKGLTNPLDDNIIILKNKEKEFYIKFSNHKIIKETVKNIIELTFTEMSEADRHQWHLTQSRLPEKLDGILVNEQFIIENDLNQWGVIGERLRKKINLADQPKYKPVFMLIAKQRKSDISLRALGKVFSNIFYKPVERSHFVKIMYLQLPSLNPTTPIEIKQSVTKEKFEVGNTVQVTEISEAGLVMNYYRPITVGSFRRFILWFPMEIGQPVMLSTSNFNKESESEKGIFENHFVFFGMQDIFLQHVRLWIRENYVLSKKGQDG